MDNLIVIPARYGSTRLPAKPLVRVGKVSLLARMIKVAGAAAKLCNCGYVVASDHEEVLRHAEELGAAAVLTDPGLPSGSDRCLAAVERLDVQPQIVINLQGDAPFTPPEHLASLVEAARASSADVLTPGIQLDWEQLDRLRSQKEKTPFSGTTCVRAADGRALWFSKSIIPAIRNEDTLRRTSAVSPVIRHVGVYGYRLDALRRYVSLPVSHYEKLEGLEQLRALEAGMQVYLALVPPPRISMSGIDTPEDVSRAEALVGQLGDPYHTGIYLA